MSRSALLRWLVGITPRRFMPPGFRGLVRIIPGGSVPPGGRGDRGRTGARGERLAARMLRRKGYKVLSRNAQVGRLEADLICMGPDRRTLVVVEVKARRAGGARDVAPEASVGEAKRRRLVSIARSVARANGWEDRPIRIDVVSVLWPAGGGRAQVRHVEGAVRLRAGSVVRG